MSDASTTVVVGAGVNGLAAAWNLVRMNAGNVIVLDQFKAGHDRGSSHGHSRITRTSYRDAHHASLVMEAQALDWPRLEREAGRTLVTPTPGLFFGRRDGAVGAYRQAVTDAHAPVTELSAADARAQFPQFRFNGDPAVLVDRSAGIVAANEVMTALRRLTAERAEIRDGCEVLAIVPSASSLRVETSQGAIEADRVIVTAGAWVPRLIPSLAAAFTVKRQTVCYFEPDGDPAAFRAPQFPVWVWLGQRAHEHVYGLPEFGREGIKAAIHGTSVGTDDPDDLPGDPSAAEVAEVDAFLTRELACAPRRLLATERCLYTNTATEDFVITRLPEDPRIVVGAACSGHAFKFAPLTGRLLAELSMTGKTSSPAFESSRPRFSAAHALRSATSSPSSDPTAKR